MARPSAPPLLCVRARWAQQGAAPPGCAARTDGPRRARCERRRALHARLLTHARQVRSARGHTRWRRAHGCAPVARRQRASRRRSGSGEGACSAGASRPPPQATSELPMPQGCRRALGLGRRSSRRCSRRVHVTWGICGAGHHHRHRRRCAWRVAPPAYLPARRPPRPLGILASLNSTCCLTIGSNCRAVGWGASSGRRRVDRALAWWLGQARGPRGRPPHPHPPSRQLCFTRTRSGAPSPPPHPLHSRHPQTPTSPPPQS